MLRASRPEIVSSPTMLMRRRARRPGGHQITPRIVNILPIAGRQAERVGDELRNVVSIAPSRS